MNIAQVGNNILFYLHQQNRTQVDLANGLGTSKQVINKIVKGKKALKIDELNAISKFLNIPLDSLLNDKNEVMDQELEVTYLYGNIKKRETADFILELIRNLSEMEEEIEEYGLLGK